MEWTHTIAAVVEVEARRTANQWRLGDALLRDNPERMGDVADDLRRERGIEISAHRLRQLRKTAEAFPPSSRRADISWEAHREAGLPENLDRAVTALRKLAKPVTPKNIKLLFQHWQDEAESKRREQHTKAKADLAKAKARLAALGPHLVED